MKPLALSAYTATSGIGTGTAAMLETLRAQRTALVPCPPLPFGLDTYVGEVAGVDAVRLPPALAGFDCRNNRLAYLGLQQDGFTARVRAAAARYGTHRVGVFLGTSTSGILETELAYAARDAVTGALPAWFSYAGAHNSFSVSAFAQRALELDGPAAVISSACSSSAKVFASAQRAIEAGLIDAAVVGGVDSLCLTTLHGFNSLQLVSRQPVRPFDRARDGLSIGEAAAFALLEPAAHGAAAVLLLGTGESSDAHHMSAPHPQGRGAREAMQQALHSAQLEPGQIQYINFHGTGTPSNDAAEAQAVAAVLGSQVPGSSTKGATGHTLGAAGALEAVVCALALREGFMPAGVNTTAVDPALDVSYLLHNRSAALRYVMSNSFGFGGSNCSLVFGQAPVGASRLAGFIEGVGLLGPGMTGWREGAAVLAGHVPRGAAATVVPALQCLPSAERRRTGVPVRIAITAGLEAVAHAGADPAQLPAIFTSSGGDGQNLHEICTALAAGERQLSPTRFHNSVHNAPSGYWGIATGATPASNALCAHDASFGAGSLESLVQMHTEQRRVLLVAYDAQYLQPLAGVRPIPDAFAVALVLAPARNAAALARLEVRLGDAAPDTLPDAGLETLRRTIPAARSLPLLELLAQRRPGACVLEYLAPGSLAVELTPCP